MPDLQGVRLLDAVPLALYHAAVGQITLTGWHVPTMDTLTEQGKFLMDAKALGVVCTRYEMNDFRCMDILKETYKNQMGLFADHIPRAGSFLIVAHDGLDAFGYVMATGSNDGTYIHLVDVLPDFQRKGIAAKMFAFLETSIQYWRGIEGLKYKANYPVMLHCMGSNIEARGLYKKMGFHTVCRVPNWPNMYEWQHVMRKNAPGK
ncbi:MAG: GNAT family N-acetyltransferase [Patescibacteria group bacterium]